MGKIGRSIVEYRVYDLPLDVPALLLQGEQWRISDELSNRLHFHNCMEIGFCHSDSGMLYFEGESMGFRAGDVVIVPRHVPHTTCSQRGTKSLWSYLFMDLTGMLSDMIPMEKALDFGTADFASQAFLVNRSHYPRIHFLANCLLEEFNTRRGDFVPMVQGLSLVLGYELQRLLEDSHPKADHSVKAFVLKPVLEYIRQHYMEQTSMKELADICHLSEPHFRRLFRSIMGTSPLNFINATRINQACILLKTTDLSILTIAETVGINSISSFNRNFHQIMGVSPREYRNTPSKASITPKHKYVLKYKGWMAAEERPEHVAESPDAPGEWNPLDA